VENGRLAKSYGDGEVIVRQGEIGDRMFIIQSGKVRMTRSQNGKEVPLSELKPGDLFGEMAIIDREVRPATVSAIGKVQVLAIDRKSFLRRVEEDPSLAFPVIQRMSEKIRELSAELTQLKTSS